VRIPVVGYKFSVEDAKSFRTEPMSVMTKGLESASLERMIQR
jgi:hypothetical protein